MQIQRNTLSQPLLKTRHLSGKPLVKNQFAIRFSGKSDGGKAEITPTSLPILSTEQLEARSEVFTIQRPYDGELKMRLWRPSVESEKKGNAFKKDPSILFVHGENSTSAEMGPLACLLSDQHPQVYGLDIEDLGYKNSNSESSSSGSPVGDIQTPNQLVSQVYDALEWLSKTHEVPVFLIGQNLGGILATLLSSTRSDNKKIKGLVLISPTFQFSEASVSRRFRFNYHLQRILQKIGLPWQPIPFPEAYAQTPLASKGYSEKVTRLTPDSWVTMKKMMQVSQESSEFINVPVLTLMNEVDSLVNPTTTHQVHQKIASPDKQMILYNRLDNGTPVGNNLIQEPDILLRMGKSIHRWIVGRAVSFNKKSD